MQFLTGIDDRPPLLTKGCCTTEYKPTLPWCWLLAVQLWSQELKGGHWTFAWMMDQFEYGGLHNVNNTMIYWEMAPVSNATAVATSRRQQLQAAHVSSLLSWNCHHCTAVHCIPAKLLQKRRLVKARSWCLSLLVFCCSKPATCLAFDMYCPWCCIL
jgi:hypothetical protein